MRELNAAVPRETSGVERPQHPAKTIRTRYKVILVVLFATVFGFLHLWASDWWVWRRFRLLAYAIVLIAAYEMLARLYKQTAVHAQELEAHVHTRTAELSRLAAIVESSDDAIISKTLDGIITSWNRGAERLYGYSALEAIGQSMTLIVPPELHTELRELLQCLARGEYIEHHETVRMCKDGRRVEVSITLSPLKDARGKIGGASAIVRDITARKLAEEKLRQSEARLQLQIERMPVGCIVWDKQFRATSWNPAAERIFGFKAEEVLGRHPYDCIVGKNAQSHLDDILQRLMQGDATAHSMNENLTADGRIIFCQWTNTPLKEADGEVIGVLSMVEDVTERKRAEDELRLSRERLALAQKAGQSGTFDWDLKNDVNHWSPEIEELYGLAAGEFGGTLRDWETLLLPEDLPGAAAAIQEAQRMGGVAAEWRIRRRNDGQIRWVTARAKVLFDEAGNPVRMIGLNMDITEHKRAERALRSVSACNEALMRATDEPSLLQRICDVMVNVGGYRMVWVGYAEHDERKTVRVVANSGVEAGYLDTVNITWADEERGHGPTGTAVRTGKVSVCYDMTSDPAFAPWRESALKRDYRSTLVLPLKSGAEVVGAISIYAAEVGAFDADEQRHLEELSNNLSYGIVALRGQAERKRAQEALRESEERFQAMANGIPQLAWMAEPDGHIFWYNQRWFEYTGTTFEQMENWGWQSVQDPTMSPKVLAAWKGAIASGLPFDMEFPLRGADGIFRTFLTRILPLKDSHGRVLRWFETNTDISEREAAEQRIHTLNQELEERVEQRTAELHESEQSVRRKLESILSPEGNLEHLELADLLDVAAVQSLAEEFYKLAHIPMFILDLKSNLVVTAGGQEMCTRFYRANPESCRNCQESDRELSGGIAPGEFKLYKCKNNLWDAATPLMLGSQQVGNLFSGQFFFTHETVDRAIFQAQARKYGFDEQEYMAALDRVPRLSQSEVEAGMRFYIRLAQLLSQLSYSGIKLARSASQIGRVNAELAASVQELEAFTYSVSHDLRAPLRHISAFSKMLTEEYGANLPPEAQHLVRRIQEGTRRMGMLVDDLLNLARVGRRDLSLQATDLQSIAEEVIAELSPDYKQRQIEWKIGDLPFLECDPGLIKQVFQNLISNSVKFTGPREKAVIEIGVRDQQGTPAIFVGDNGVGFRMKYADKLFGVFQRLHRMEDFEGTGVGLATVQRIVQKHGGRIWAEAELDKGATFYFTLAASDPKAAGKSDHSTIELKSIAAAAGDKK